MIDMCKQMGLDANFADAKKAVTTAELDAELDAELAKMEYTQVCSSEKKRIMAVSWRAQSPTLLP
jgi:hypothetical protein